MATRPALRNALLGASVLLFTLPLNSQAGTLTLLDLTDTVTLMDDTGRATLACSSGEACTVALRAPAGTALFSQNFMRIDWVEPGTTEISDSFCTLAFPCAVTTEGASIGFVSDTEGGSLGTCATCAAETGMPQTAAAITWLTASGATIVTDTIRFQSDVSDVPEPSSRVLALVGGAVSASLLRILRRYRNAEP